MDEINTKKTIHQLCLKDIQERLEVIEQRLASIQESRNNETKSSVGDKYETGRAMMQIEENNINLQKSKILEQRKVLENINPLKTSENITVGTLVFTNQMNFYISTALGKIRHQKEVIYCISIDSPIGKILKGKKQGDAFIFNNREYELVKVF